MTWVRARLSLASIFLAWTFTEPAIPSAPPVHSSPTGAAAPDPRPTRSAAGEAAVADRVVEDRVVIRLAAEAMLAGSDLRVRVQGERILLVGSVPSNAAGRLAERIAASSGRAVESRVERSSARQPTPTDDDLASDVTYLLGMEFEGTHAGDDPMVGWRVDGGHWELGVAVADREVTLDGSVPAPHDVRRAVETAWRVEGVRRVRAELELAGDRTPSVRVRGQGAE